MSHRCQSILRAANGRLLAEIASVSGTATWSCDSRALSSRGPTVVRFQGRDDAANPERRLGSATDARRVDPGRNTTLGDHVGGGFDENPVSVAQPSPCFSG